MMEKIISIVIPTYNMEKYLARCLDSVLIEGILEKIEIIVVNDGSTDNSLSIASSYVEKFPQSAIIIDKPNGNYGSCINAALRIASGKYFKILDADDWFDSVSFVQLVNGIQYIEVDMILTNFSLEYDKGINKIAVEKTNKIIANHQYDFINYNFLNHRLIDLLSMHSIAYRTQLLRTLNYKQTEGISYTDTEYCFYPLRNVKTFIYFDIVLYRYYIGREGQTVSESSLIKNKEHPYIIICRMLEYFASQKDYGTVREEQYALFERILRYYYRIILVFCKKNIEDEMKLKKIDTCIQDIDKAIFERMNKIQYYNIQYIRLWREKGIYANETQRLSFLKKYIALTTLLKKSNAFQSLYYSLKKRHD